MRRQQTFLRAREKADLLDGEASLDTRLRPVRAIAAQYETAWRARGSKDVGELARNLQHFVRDTIAYVRDGQLEGRPGEEFADSEVVLQRGYDDCDGKARLFVALCRCVGIAARIRPVFDHPDDFVHVQAEVRWPGSERHPLAEDGGWLVAELILANCELGQDVDTLPRDRRGNRIIAHPFEGPLPPRKAATR